MNRVILPMSGLVALLLLGGCMETMPRPERPRPERPRPPRPPRPDAPICTMDYAPVCAAKGRDRRTFGNACQAKAEGYRVIRPQPCGN